MLPFLSLSGFNRPTVSMTPHGDGATVRQYLTPISTETLIFLVHSGWPVETVMRIWLDAVNGVPNWIPPSGPVPTVPPDIARFRRASQLLQVIQER